MKTASSVAGIGILLLGTAFGGMGCSPCDSTGSDAPACRGLPRPAEGEFSVMTFNLNDYSLMDGDKAHDTLEPSARKETAALIDVITDAAPDILAVQEMGNPAAWADFKLRLRKAGLAYDYEEYLRVGDQDLNMAVLSRYPITAHQSHTDDRYTIGPTQFPLQRGIIEVDIGINPDYTLRLLVAHLKSNLYHAYGQAEMRRNEARLLNKNVRASLDRHPEINLLVVGDMNVTPDTALFRDIVTYQDQPILFDLRPADAAGDAWTYRENNDSSQRLDYMLVSQGLLPEVLLDKTFAIRSRQLLQASDHRPLVATFTASEQDPESAPDLTQGLPPKIPMND
jgi:endonuclease/exonuclease/phosphatase family metal-dependent hydrolase